MSSRQIRRLQNLILASEGEDYGREDLAPSMMQSKNAGKKKNKKVKCKTEEEEVSKGHSTSNQDNCNAVGAEQYEHHQLQEEYERCEEHIMPNSRGQEEENEEKGANANIKELQDETITNKNNNDNNKSKGKAKKQLRMKKRQALAEEDALLDALLSNAEQQQRRQLQSWQNYDNELTTSTFSKSKERKSNHVGGAVVDQLEAREATTTHANSKKNKQMSYTNTDICTKSNSTATSNITESEISNTLMSEEECLNFDFISYLTNCDTTRMNTRLERIRAFGPASVEDIGDGLARNNLMGGSNGALSSSAAANNNSWSLFAFNNRKLLWKTNVFVSPNRYRWFPYDNLGVHLGLLNEDNKHSTQSSINTKESDNNKNDNMKKDLSHKTKKNNNNKLETHTSIGSANRYPLRYVLHCEDSPAFQRAEHRLQECIAFSPQPNTLLECLLVNKVYHLPSLKACYSMLMAMNETNKAGELADCAMYHIGEILKFFPLNGDWRRRVLPYYEESNPHIYWALKVGADVARSRGCMRTTWEMHKLILSLNPHDPIRVLSVIDIPALQAKRWMWLVELMENAKRAVECEEGKKTKCKHDAERQNDKKEILKGEGEQQEDSKVKASTSTGKDANVQWNLALARHLYLMPHLVYSAALAKHCLEREIKNLMTHASSPLAPSSPTLPKERSTSTNVKRNNSSSNDISATHDVCAWNRNSSKVLKELSNTQWEDLVESILTCCKSNYKDSISVGDDIRVHFNDKRNSKYSSAAEMLAEAMVQFPLMAVELVSALQGINTIVTRCGWQIAPANYKSMTRERSKNNENSYIDNDNYVRTEMKETKVPEKVQEKHHDDDNNNKKIESKIVFIDNDAWSEIEDQVNAAREHNSLLSLQQMCDFTSELVKNRAELWKPTEMLQLIAQVIIIPVNSSTESILAKRLRQAKQEMQKHLLVRSTPLKFSLNREKRLSSLLDALKKRAQESDKRINTTKNNDAQYDKEENIKVLNLMKINENDTNMMQNNNDNHVENWTERAIVEMLIHYSQGGEISFMNPADAAFVQDPNELMNMMAGNNNQANANEEEQEVEMIYGGDSDNDYDDLSTDDNDFIEDTTVD